MLVLVALFACQPGSSPTKATSPVTTEDAETTPPELSDTALPASTTADTGNTAQTDPLVPPVVSSGIGWVRVAAGPAVTCAIREPGDIECWGDPASPLMGSEPAGLFVEIDVGDDHACAVSVTGELACWGDDTEGKATPPQGVVWDQVACGGGHTCSLSEGGLVHCWGADAAGQLDLPIGLYDQVVTGAAHTCGRARSDGVVVCAGDDSTGAVSGAESLGNYTVGIAAGSGSTCAITSNDYVSRCVGDLANSQFNNDYLYNVDIDVGDGFATVVSEVFSPDLLIVGRSPWGSQDVRLNLRGELPFSDVASVDRVTAGGRHVCVVSATTRELVCLGDDSDGQVTIPL